MIIPLPSKPASKPETPSEIKKLLAAAGLRPGEKTSEILEEYGLGVRNLIEDLALLKSNAMNDATRMQAVQTGLKLHGLMNTNKVEDNSNNFNLVIYAPSLKEESEYPVVELSS